MTRPLTANVHIGPHGVAHSEFEDCIVYLVHDAVADLCVFERCHLTFVQGTLRNCVVIDCILPEPDLVARWQRCRITWTQAPPLPDRRRTRCAFCHKRRLCWPLPVRGTGLPPIPTCDWCLFELPTKEGEPWTLA